RRVNRIKTTLICECEPEFPAALASDPTEVTGKGLCLPICHISCRPYKGCPDVNGFRTSLPSNAEDSHPEPSFALSLFRGFSRRPGPHSARNRDINVQPKPENARFPSPISPKIHSIRSRRDQKAVIIGAQHPRSCNPLGFARPRIVLREDLNDQWRHRSIRVVLLFA